jgi:hypothetical protein
MQRFNVHTADSTYADKRDGYRCGTHSDETIRVMIISAYSHGEA